MTNDLKCSRFKIVNSSFDFIEIQNYFELENQPSKPFLIHPFIYGADFSLPGNIFYPHLAVNLILKSVPKD